MPASVLEVAVAVERGEVQLLIRTHPSFFPLVRVFLKETWPRCGWDQRFVGEMSEEDLADFAVIMRAMVRHVEREARSEEPGEEPPPLSVQAVERAAALLAELLA